MLSMVESFSLSMRRDFQNSKGSVAVNSRKTSISQKPCGRLQKTNGNDHKPKALIAEKVIPFHEAEQSMVLTEF
jgi:hypothetical protein